MYETDCEKYDSEPENYLPKELEDIEIQHEKFKNSNKKIDELTKKRFSYLRKTV